MSRKNRQKLISATEKALSSCARSQCMTEPLEARRLLSTVGFLAQPVLDMSEQPSQFTSADFDADGDVDFAVTKYDDTIGVFMNNGSGSFAAEVTYPAGSYPGKIIGTDLSGDGKPDLAIVNAGTGNISVLLNCGDGTFAAKTDYSSAGYASSLSAGDIDADGDADLAATNSSLNSVSIFLNNGNGIFTSGSNFTTGTGPGSITASDLNADGKADLVVGNLYSNSISVLMSLGGGSFATKVDYTTGTNSQPRDIAAGDLNADGKPDLAVADFVNGKVGVFINAGNGTLGTRTDHSTGPQPTSVVIFDLNGANGPDLAVANSNGSGVGNASTVTTLLNNGNGTFANKADRATAGSVALSAADFDGDGSHDLGVLSSFYRSLTMMLNDGSGALQLAPEYSVGPRPRAVASADFDSDGDNDLATANYGTSGTAGLSVILNNGNGTLQAKTDYVTSDNPSAVCAVDFHNDGKVDLAVADYGSARISIFRGNGNGTFQSKTDYYIGYNPNSMVAADLNGDGFADIATGSPSGYVSVMVNNGNGTFMSPVDYATGGGTWSVSAADFNGDGEIDLAAVNYFDDTVSILLNNGSGSGLFASKVDYLTGSDPTYVAAADLNSDGRADLAITNEGASTVSVLLNTGSGIFAAKTDYATGRHPTAVSIADLDGDEKGDLVIASPDSSSVSVLLRNGFGTFADKVSFSANQRASALVAIDLNGDRSIDLAVVNGKTSVATTNTIAVLINTTPNSEPGFNVTTFDVYETPSTAVTADFDGDGWADIASAPYSSGATLSVLLNNGNGTFATHVDYATIFNGGNMRITAADFDGDTVPDIALWGDAGPTNHVISVFLNNGDGTFGSEIFGVSTSLQANDFVAADLDNDGYADLVTPSSNDTVGVFWGNGDGTFAARVGYTTDLDPTSVSAADFNDDGYLDLMTGNSSGQSVSVLLNNANGTFAPNSDYSTGIGIVNAVAADLNGDGIPDIASTNAGSYNMSVLLNNGDGTFAAKTDYAYGGFNTAFSIAAVDLNNDGRPELVTHMGGTGDSRVYTNNGDGTFIYEDTFSFGTVLAFADFDHDSLIDLVTSAVDQVRIHFRYL